MVHQPLWIHDSNCLSFSLEGPPVDPDEDSDNSAIYVQGLNDGVTLDDLVDFFKQCGVVKVSKNMMLCARTSCDQPWGILKRTDLESF